MPRKHLITPLKYKHLNKEELQNFAKALIANGFNQTEAYKSIRPGVSTSTAEQQGTKLANSKGIIQEVKAALDSNGLDVNNMARYLNIAITSGLGKKATNRDAVSGLKLVSEIHSKEENTDLEATERLDLERLSSKELMNKLDDLGKEIRQIKREGAIEAVIVSDSKI